MFPHTVTVYNTETEELSENDFEPTLVNHITVLRGVLLDASKGSNVTKSGLEGADAVNLYNCCTSYCWICACLYWGWSREHFDGDIRYCFIRCRSVCGH